MSGWILHTTYKDKDEMCTPIKVQVLRDVEEWKEKPHKGSRTCKTNQIHALVCALSCCGGIHAHYLQVRFISFDPWMFLAMTSLPTAFPSFNPNTPRWRRESKGHTESGSPLQTNVNQPLTHLESIPVCQHAVCVQQTNDNHFDLRPQRKIKISSEYPEDEKKKLLLSSY